jgi:hypothetical protein
MEVKRYDSFITEAKKDDAKEEIIKMLNSKPTVTMSNENWPTEKDIYTQAGVCRYLKDKYTSSQVLGALNDIKNDKKIELKSIRVKNFHYNENYPYFYLGLSEEEAQKVKEKYEEKNEVANKETITKRKEVKAASKKATDEKKRPAKKVAAKKVGTAKKVADKKVTPAKKVAAKKVVPAKKVAAKKLPKK